MYLDCCLYSTLLHRSPLFSSTFHESNLSLELMFPGFERGSGTISVENTSCGNSRVCDLWEAVGNRRRLSAYCYLFCFDGITVLFFSIFHDSNLELMLSRFERGSGTIFVYNTNCANLGFVIYEKLPDSVSILSIGRGGKIGLRCWCRPVGLQHYKLADSLDVNNLVCENLAFYLKPFHATLMHCNSVFFMQCLINREDQVAVA